MTAAIVIVTYNSAAQIGVCLEALAGLAPPQPCEVVVVDNGSQDGTVGLVRERFPRVRLLAEQENWGFAGGVNRGVAAAVGEQIALLNPDAVPEPGWLAALLAALADPQAGVAGSKVRGGDGRLQSVGSELRLPLVLAAHRGEGEIDTGQYDAPAEVWAAHGAAMAFPRRLWETLGGFDEGYFPAYWEEVDFCERARRAGYRVTVAPAAVVRHATEASSTTKYSSEFYFYFHRNRLRYALRWLDHATLWDAFRPAERARLAAAPLADRRVARVAYQLAGGGARPAGQAPPAAPLAADERRAILDTGRGLREGRLPADGLTPLLALLEELRANSVLEEVQFRSRLPLVARLRTAWNNVATRWYVRPSLDRQTRFNLATQRALEALLLQLAADSAASALDIALLGARR